MKFTWKTKLTECKKLDVTWSPWKKDALKYGGPTSLQL